MKGVGRGAVSVAGALAAVVAGALAMAAKDAGDGAMRFEDWSDGATMRLDYEHSGKAAAGGRPAEEAIALDAFVREGPWPGGRTPQLDPMNLGAYRYEVRDRGTHRLLFAAGFGSIYGEWETTDEAKRERRSFHESLRFPFPKRPVQVDLYKRAPDNAWRPLALFLVDPMSPSVRREKPSDRGTVRTLFENGAPERKVDLLILGDGYTAAEMPKFHADAKRLVTHSSA